MKEETKTNGGPAVVLVSGGLDSAVTAAAALKDGPAALLHVNYGQRTEARELKAFNALADHYGVTERLVATVDFLSSIGGSALTDASIEVPEGDLTSRSVPPTYVPFRNALFLSIAVSWAEVLGSKEVYIGAVEEDNSGYPDCRREFLESFQQTVLLGTRPETAMAIRAPLIEMRRADIVRLGAELDTPFELTWSCYSDSDLACGRCDSCLLRLKGFKEASIEDPIRYKNP